MIYSMTAFARSQDQNEMGNLICEMRSINHRYLEISVFLPEILRILEMPIRECVHRSIKRGKLECFIRYQQNPSESGALFKINKPLVNALCHASEEIAGCLKNPAPIGATDILRFPGILETQEINLEALKAKVLQLVEKNTDELIAARAREGEELKHFFLQRLQLMEQELKKISERVPKVSQEQQARLKKRFDEAKLELDPVRLEQEMLMFIQKIDIVEELERTETHINEMRRIFHQGSGPVGRRLDFLSQELNREANTIASKSIDPVITHAAVEMKVLIEQTREQIQNVE